MTMKPITRSVAANCAMDAGLAIKSWRSAPRLATVITAGIALPLANTLMLLKRRRVAASGL